MRGTLRDRWRREVLRTSAVTDSCKLLLVVMADEMNADGYISITRPELCRRLDRSDRRIAERIQQAVEARLLDRVQRGQKGRTAVYRAMLPDTFSTTDRSTLMGQRRAVQHDGSQHADQVRQAVQHDGSERAEPGGPQHPENGFSKTPGGRASSNHPLNGTGLAAVPAARADKRDDEERTQVSPLVVAARESWARYSA